MADSGFASLNPTLLARKGGAKPAMRPQSGMIPGMVAESGFSGNAAHNLEDLGWNDMGDEAPEREAQVLHLTPAAANEEAAHEAIAVKPEVHAQHEEIAERIAEPFVEASPAKKAPKAKSNKSPDKSAAGKRAAFTLRLDAERHLRLRLASTVEGRSAQAIVTEALDALLGTMPELEQLAARVSRK